MSPVDNPAAVAPWIASQARTLLAQRGHAWLLAGPSGLGQFELAMAMVRAWLCEAPTFQGACGICGSCHAIDVRTHADLLVLMPETEMLSLQWPLSEKAQEEIDAKKRKPSKEIRVEAMRDAIEFAQRTSARGRGKAVLLFPADRMNVVTANALLKTLEEPPGDVKFVLATESAHQLLPTIRSRCLGHTMLWPDHSTATAWLQGQGVAPAHAQTLLLATGGRVQGIGQLAQHGERWALLPRAVQQGDVKFFADWTATQTVDALQKLCHDQMVLRCGAKPRFFAPEHLMPPTSWQSLADWADSLIQVARHVEHPYNLALMQESLIGRAQLALTPSL